MLGCVVDGESAPDLRPDFDAESVDQGLAPVDVEVVQDEMDRGGLRILQRQFANNEGELKGRAVRRREGEVPPGLRLYSTEDIGGPAAAKRSPTGSLT